MGYIYVDIYIPKSYGLWTVCPCFYDGSVKKERSKYLNLNRSA